MNKMEELQVEIGLLLIECEKIFARRGVKMSLVTLFARDPNNNNMVLMLTNDPEPRHSFEIVMENSSEFTSQSDDD